MKIISKPEAKALGLKYFYTGVPCVHGHIDLRSTASGKCAECVRIRGRLQCSRNPLRNTWNMMIHRCHNEEDSCYENYGGRGITVCDRWLDPEEGLANFVSDMGPRPEGFTLDRIDSDGRYEPSNCRWADWVTQCRNRRSTKLQGEDVLEVFRLHDSGMSKKEIGGVYGCTYQNIGHILKNREKYIEQGLGRSTQAAAG